MSPGSGRTLNGIQHVLASDNTPGKAMCEIAIENGKIDVKEASIKPEGNEQKAEKETG
jgi:hypothetical protein